MSNNPKLATEQQVKDVSDTFTEIINHQEKQIKALESGVIDAIEPSSPAPTKRGEYKVTKPGIYLNFKDGNGQPISVTEEDYSSGNVSVIYNGTDNRKLVVPITFEGEVKEGDTRGVSGGGVYKYTYDKSTIDNYININPLENFDLFAGYYYKRDNGSVGRSESINWVSAISDVVEGGTYVIRGFSGGSSAEMATSNRVCFIMPNLQESEFVSSRYGETETIVTIPTGCTKISVVCEGTLGIGSDIPNSKYWEVLVISRETGKGEDGLLGSKIVGDIETKQIKKLEIGYNTFESLMDVSHIPQALSLTTGAILPTGSTDSTAQGYKRTSISSSSSPVSYNGKGTYEYSGTITNSKYCGVLYLDKDFKVLGSECSEPIVYTNFELTPNNGTKYIATCSYLSDPVITEKVTSITGGTMYTTICVDGMSQSDIEDGSMLNPFKTINAAISKAVTGSTILIKGGDYRETLDLASVPLRIHFKAMYGETVRVLGSERLTNWLKVVGSENIYECSYTKQVPNWARFKRPIFEDKNPSKEILREERHPLQRGLSHRLPFTILEEVDSLDKLKTDRGVFYEDGKIYINSETNPNTNGFNYEIAVRNCNTVKGKNIFINTDIFLENIQFFYTLSGLRANHSGSINRINCSSFATRGAGAFQDDVSRVFAINDEAAASDVDGLNGHFATFGPVYKELTDHRNMQPLAHYIDPWCHDNMDDGISHHENHRVLLRGGLSEYNGDGGLRASNDSGYTIYDFYSRRNGWWKEVSVGGAGGEGISAVNPTINPNRNGCKVIAYNSVFEHNNCGVASISHEDNVVELVNCITRNNVKELYCSEGIIISRNTRATNADLTKLKVISGTGVIEILNDDILV